ncbi:MAG: MmgE/PrpD family protein [Sedimentibacter sp.]|jgi:2-methylcitrate dehydratase PrpD|nr:MmgE/PrpD family protein [Sedimentibacter sp.]
MLVNNVQLRVKFIIGCEYMNELEQLSDFIFNFDLDNTQDNVVETAKICILDSFSAAVGASKDKLIVDIIGKYKEFYNSENENGISVWGHNIKLPVVQAAFINAMMGHKLELDDVHTNSKTHIGTVVVPSAMCLAQYLKSSAKEFLEAVICGYEVMSRIGMGFGVSSHRNKGWHVTSTAGTFGAAAAAAKLLKLNIQEITNALGMAGTQSFGLWAFLEDSASSKILHPARAASSGIEAAMLAKAGMTGPVNILSANDGNLFAAMSDEYDLAMVTKDLGVVFEIKNVDNKPYPCCRSTHCAIDSALYLKNSYNIDIEDIEEIKIGTYLVGYKQCGLTEGSKNPRTSTEAKFSTPYTFATALINGNVSLEHFTAESINNYDVQSLLKKVSVCSEEEFTLRYPMHWGCKAKIIMKSGNIYETEVKDASGSTYNPVSKNDIKNKAIPLLKVAYEEDNVIEKILNIEKYSDLYLESFMN